MTSFKVIFSCKSSVCTVYHRLSLVRCLSVCFQGFGFEDYPCILCLYREPEDLLLPIYASYKWFFCSKRCLGNQKWRKYLFKFSSTHSTALWKKWWSQAAEGGPASFLGRRTQLELIMGPPPLQVCTLSRERHPSSPGALPPRRRDSRVHITLDS